MYRKTPHGTFKAEYGRYVLRVVLEKIYITETIHFKTICWLREFNKNKKLCLVRCVTKNITYYTLWTMTTHSYPMMVWKVAVKDISLWTSVITILGLTSRGTKMWKNRVFWLFDYWLLSLRYHRYFDLSWQKVNLISWIDWIKSELTLTLLSSHSLRLFRRNISYTSNTVQRMQHC